MISIDVLPLMTGNMAWLNEAFIAGHMPINVDVMHRYWGFGGVRDLER
jgi:hypothetical protein